MAFFQPLSTMTDLVVVAFILGFASAALVFWPLLRRGKQRLAAQRACTHSLSRGRHALRDPLAARTANTTTASATAVTVLAAHRRSPAPGRAHAEESPSPESPQADGRPTVAEQANADLPTAPQPRIAEPVEVPQLPTDLFERRYEAQFEHARKRIERLRAQLD
jgi:hypothetical protein